MPNSKKKIAILGGGCGAIAAAWTLAHLPEWQERFEITVYQLGWRLGGKGASGRDASAGERIEEHGLHVWAGFYENAFRFIQDAYREMPSRPEDPLRSWSDAFKKHSAVMLEDRIDGDWVSWPIDFPEDTETPGTGGVLPSPWGYLCLTVAWLEQLFDRSTVDERLRPRSGFSDRLARWFVTESQALDGVLGAIVSLIRGKSPSKGATTAPTPGDLISAGRVYSDTLSLDPGGHRPHHHHTLLRLMDEAGAGMRAMEARDDAERIQHYRLRVILDLACTTIRGLIRDEVLLHGFERIDKYEWTDWLDRHGARAETLDCGVVRGIYDYVFGYACGDSSRRNLAAGVAMHGVVRLLFTYKGALFWEMQAGMGDTVFAPPYLALKARGVRFKFFQRVDALIPSERGNIVERIKMRSQTTVRGAEYEPLIRVKGVPSWPSRPLYGQLEDGDVLEARDINLESAWSPWQGRPYELERGRDFDEVILGISIGAYRDICADLVARAGAFSDMVEHVGTVQTAATQLWLDRDAEAIGAPARRIVSGYAQTLNICADMSFLLPREQWPEPGGPRFLAYFCGPFADAPEIPPFDDYEFPARELERYKRIARGWLEKHIGGLWPEATRRENPHALDLSLLYDPDHGSGEQRLARQYFRVNIDPSERYVLSGPGTTRYRLRAGETGYDNLYMAGDWVRTPINAGCVEAAVMAGMDAARALSGDEVEIIGGWSK